MPWFSIWMALALFAALLWLARFFAVEHGLRARCLLHEGSHPDSPQSVPMVSIVLAGKDEQESIETCVRSLMDQDYPNFELIVIDDRSNDRTPQILAQLALEFPKLRILRVEHLPRGWFGKHNAVRTGMEQARGDWLLFTDADCRQTSRRTLSLAMSEARRHQSDFLSVIPNLERRTLWERVLQPICAAILVVWFRPSRVNDPRTKAAYANGAFMLMSRTCYEVIGGHHAVRDKINEDIHMAAIAKQRGQRLRVVENQGLYSVRMYDTFRAGFHGWSRIFYGCLEKPSRVLFALGLVFWGGVVPWLSFLASLVLVMLSDDPRWLKALAAWGGVVFLIQLVTARLYSKVGYGLGWSLSYGFGAMVASVILLNSLLKSLGVIGTTWRKTTYAPAVAVRDSSAVV